MNQIELFQKLKNKVLLSYKEQFPYFEGNWKSFSSQDIQNLITLIEQKTKQTISEKWIYTHLKPETNEKLPRKDMLDILSNVSGYSSWDEFVFKNKSEVEVVPKKEESKKWKFIFIGIFSLIGLGFGIQYFSEEEKNVPQTIEVKNAVTNEIIHDSEIKAVVVENDEEIPLKMVDSKFQLTVKDSAKVILKSPYFDDKTVIIKNEPKTNIVLQPDDYAMMLKAFLKSDIKDWQTRKEQLNKILADDVEIMVMLKDDLGAEYFNKEEFSQKVIVPSVTLKRMRIIEIEHNNDSQINFIRIIQE